MFKFIPNTAVPGFRVGRPDDDELGFNVADDGSTPPVLPGASDVPTVGDDYPFGATSPGSATPQAPSPNPVAPPGTGPSQGYTPPSVRGMRNSVTRITSTLSSFSSSRLATRPGKAGRSANPMIHAIVA